MNAAFSDTDPEFNRILIIGIVRHISYDAMIPILQQYAASGLTNIEITMNTKDCADIIRYAVSQYRDKLQIGAGTVCSLQDLDTALQAGAKFIVSPIVNDEVIKTCVEYKIPVYPGAYTPTEIYKAWSLGAEMVKVFPAASLEPDYVRDIKSALNTIKLLPTGGINLHNIDGFIEAGADGFGLGTTLFDPRHIETQNWNALRENFEAFASKQFVTAGKTDKCENK
jgi:2-dehydro-3-deoxyphosphogluconate aldolase/(4S)-4-hydroxy-2-oxoglutarate aldolase